MTRAVIIDDEPLARSLIREYLQPFTEVEVVQECSDGFEGVKAIRQHQPALIFLDIQMPKINGFEMLELLEQPPSVIFTTAYDEYAIRAFEIHAVDYLLKPFSRARFDKALRKFLEQPAALSRQESTKALLDSHELPAQSERVVVKTAGKIKIIPTAEILYIEGADDYVKVCTAAGAFLKNKTMAYFEKVLDSGSFVRTHRSYIVNVQEITRINPHEKDNYMAVLKSGMQVPVSRTGYARLRTVLGI